MTAPFPSLIGRLLFAAVLMWLLPGAAAAEATDFAAQVQALAQGGFQQKIDAVGALAGSGDDHAEAVLAAMLDGRLYVRRDDGRVLIGREQGSVVVLTDPLTGSEIGQTPAADLDSIGVNNRLRGVLRGALGSLTLASSDPGKRAAAADAMFRTRDSQQLPLLEQALARETDHATRTRMLRTQAAIVLTTDRPAEERVAAAETLARFADREVASHLASVLAGTAEPAVATAIKASLTTIEGKLAVWSAVGNLFQGISLGSVLLLAAVGLAITFGVMGVINMAHGELVMIGAYVTFVVQDWFRGHAPGGLDYALAIAVPLAFVVTGLVGIAIERGIIRFLYGRPLETLLATWGLSLILQQAVRTLFGPTNREVSNPSWMSGAIEVAGGLTLTYNRVWIIVFSLVVFAGLMLLIRGTSFGLRMRAVTQNRRMAASMGIPTGRIDALTFGLGSGIAGIAGVALSQIDNVSPNLGQSYIIDSFMVVVFGGVGNLWGTLIGAFSLGIVNKLLEPYAGAVLGKIFILVAIILFIQRRPRGLFALKGRAVEQ
ncbi:MAG: urea ABC transporter permease subunit UrtB [Rhodospirillales bacterium]